MKLAILEFRSRARAFVQAYHIVLYPFLRFLLAFIAFHSINQAIGYDKRLTGTPIVLLLSLFCAFIPMILFILVTVIFSLLHLYCASAVLAILALVIFVVLYCFVARFSGKLGYVVVAVPILYLLNIPYLAPIFVGLIGSAMGIFPVTCGVIAYYVFQILQSAVVNSSVTNVDDMLALYIRVIDEIIGNKEMFINIAIFAAVILVMSLIKKLPLEYIFEITIGVGASLCILGFLFAYLQLDIAADIGTMILGTIGSMLIVFVIQFFRLAVDYTAVVRTQFEDDEYYYYVKAVPKMDISRSQKAVKRFGAETEEESDSEEEPSVEEEPTEEEEDFSEPEEFPKS